MHLPVPCITVGLLLCSNVFMTFAWCVTKARLCLWSF